MPMRLADPGTLAFCPRQMSTAGGCAGVQLGARAVALASELKHGLGLTLRKSARVLQVLAVCK